MSSPAAMREFYELVGAHCEDLIAPEQAARLQEMVVSDAELRRCYVLCMHIQGAAERSLATLQPTDSIAPAESESPSFAPRTLGAEPAAEPATRTNSSSALGFLDSILRVSGETRIATALMWTVMAILCSGMVLTIFFCFLLILHGIGVSVHGDAPQVAKAPAVSAGDKNADETADSIPHPSSLVPRPSATVARLIHSYDCRWAVDSRSPHTGDDLETGRKLVLQAGLAEILFQSGVRAVVQGPATLEISSKMSAFLHRGRVTVAVIDPDARGFEIDTPGMKYTDLGTEFGVFVAKDGAQEMRVFRGAVRADVAANLPSPSAVVSGGRGAGEGLLNPSSVIAHPSSLILSANQAIRVAAKEQRIEQISADETRFIRIVPEPKAFPLFSTGAGLDRGASDPHWEIVAVSTQPDFRPRPALVVLKPYFDYAKDSRSTGQWISLVAETATQPSDCRWTFRTRFDLSGFDPDSASIEGKFAADDWIDEMRLNGRAVPVTDRGEYRRMHRIQIAEGFIAGENILEIVVKNRSTTERNPMALCVAWKGTARKLLKQD